MAKALKMTRGNIAKALSLNAETLRFYEKAKLINQPMRSLNNYRLYTDEDVRRLKFILMAKQLGFTLKEIKELLGLSVNEKTNRSKVRTLSQQISDKLNVKIKQLTEMKKILDDLILLCKSKKMVACPILKALKSSQEVKHGK